MALGTVQQITAAGITPVFGTPGATETVIPNDDQFLYITNGGGSAITVTFTDPTTTLAGSAATNPSYSIAAAASRIIYLNPVLANPGTNLVTVTFSSTTSVTAALFRM
jgi:hypothetical protein